MPFDDTQASSKLHVHPRRRSSSPRISVADSMSNMETVGSLDYERANQFFPLEVSSAVQSPKSLLPPFPSRQYSQLPTPQSPNSFASYIGPAGDSRHSPHSPSIHGPFNSLPSSLGTEHSRLVPDSNDAPNSRMITPDSSPLNARWASCHDSDTLRSRTPPHLQPSPFPDTLGAKHKPSTPPHTAITVPMPSIAPLSPRLSSPFAPTTPHAAKVPSRHQPGSPIRATPRADSPLTPSYRPREATSPISPPLEPGIKGIPSPAGGEMDRIRQAMLENRIALLKETEIRRPDYLKREKRVDTDADFTATDKIGPPENEKAMTIGITHSPNKGRRLKLFQETSDESFEESLMAGGYGRYRTADWVRQPQPLALSAASISGPSNIVALLEQAPEVPMTERELKKRKRLEAFRRDKTLSSQLSTLLPAELEGKGRVLIDPTREARDATSKDPLLMKRRSGGRKKKKNPILLVKEERQLISDPVAKHVAQWPNWTDHEFPWRLRTEEMTGIRKAEHENRLNLIEKYLDRDSDDGEDEVEEVNEDSIAGLDPNHSDDFRLQRARIGRGKMVPLATKPHSTGLHESSGVYSGERKMFPCDPADARIALRAKKSVRTLSYRLQRRQQSRDDEGMVCICNGTDDGRPLVQCDGCEKWYHLQCIGIKSIVELGREEDPWFCHSCENKSRASSESEEMLSSEPTFVPTDDEPSLHRTHDTPFFQPPSPHDSPSWSFERVPRTPTLRSSDIDPPSLSSGSSWINSSRHGPSTPQHAYGVRIYNQDTENYNNSFEESPFDPASTPSRGIKFGAAFLTPKNTVWPGRSCLLQTPSKPSGRNPSRSALPSFGEDINHKSGAWFSPLSRFSGLDESPARSRAGEEPQTRRHLGSPSTSRSHPVSLLDESPIVRSGDKEKM